LARSQNTQQVLHVTGLEEANTLLRAELEATRTKLAEVEHREWTLTSENECLKRDLEGAHSTRSCNEGKRVGAAS
jgi:uncharacterized small protein (DUF1192 family)